MIIEKRYYYIEGIPDKKYKYEDISSKLKALNNVVGDRKKYLSPSAKIFHCKETTSIEEREVKI